MTTRIHDTVARFGSRLLYALCVLAAVSIIAFLALISSYLLYRGSQALWQARSVFFARDPVANIASPDYPGGMRSAVVGTAMMVALASLAGVPIGILTGIFLAEYEEIGRASCRERGESWGGGGSVEKEEGGERET